MCNSFSEQSPSPTASNSHGSGSQSSVSLPSSAHQPACVASGSSAPMSSSVSVGSENAGSNPAPMQGVTPTLVDKTNSTALTEQSNNGCGSNNSNANNAPGGKAGAANAEKPKPAMSAAEKQKLQAKKSLRRL